MIPADSSPGLGSLVFHSTPEGIIEVRIIMVIIIKLTTPLLSDYHVPGIVVSTLRGLSHFVLTTPSAVRTILVSTTFHSWGH